MNRRNYILAGNHLMLDELYAEKAQLVKDNAALVRLLNAHKMAVSRLKTDLVRARYEIDQYRIAENSS